MSTKFHESIFAYRDLFAWIVAAFIHPHEALLKGRDASANVLPRKPLQHHPLFSLH